MIANRNLFGKLALLALIVVFTSCKHEQSTTTGWNYNDRKNGGFEVVVIEALFGKTTVKGHLATFETRTNRAAGAGLLPLVSFTRSLTLTGTFTAAETLDTVLGALVRAECMKFHDTEFRCAILDRLFLLFATTGEDLVAGAEQCQRLEGRFHHVGVVLRTE